MQTFRRVSKRIGVTLLTVVMSVLLATFVKAQTNNILVIQLPNQEAQTDSLEGYRFLIWHIGQASSSTTQAEFAALVKDLDQRSVDQLNQAYPQPVGKMSSPSDGQGKVTYNNLADGRYYVRQVIDNEKDITYSPFIVDLPQETDTGPKTLVTVTLKKFTAGNPELPKLGGRKFMKVDEADKPLAKAYFKVVKREVTDKGDYVKNEQGAYVYLDVLLAGKTVLLESGSDGRFQVEGLTYGTYWLVETVSPQGYSLLNEPLEFTVTKTSLEESSVIKIINKKTPKETPGKVIIPSTGDIAIILLVLVGIGLVILGGWLTRSSVKSR